jgi:DNA-binding transcriptional MerR regulator
MEQHYFKTAEFAALCGVKKDTLLHYDRIGLLKPERVGENGYRFYSVRQLATYDLIAALRRLGTPLGEIRDYLTRRSPQALLALLEEKEKALEAERRRLEQVGDLLRSATQATRLAREVTPGEIRLEELEEATFAVIPAPDFASFEEGVYLLHVRELLAWARANGSSSQTPGDIIRRESLEAGKFLEDYYGCRVPKGTKGWETRTRERGIYAVLYHQGPYQSEVRAVKKLRDWVWAQGYALDGDLYEEDLVNNTAAEDPRRYLLRLYVKIK